MAYKDASGKITIDEQAAEYDIRRLREAKSYLQESRQALNNLISQATMTQGEVGSAIIEKAGELRGQVDAMITRLDETISFTQNTVAHYKQVDAQLKQIIAASQAAPDKNAAVQESVAKADKIAKTVLKAFGKL